MTTKVIYAGLDLLDRQIVDADEELVGKVDDVELTDGDSDHAPRLTALLLGPQAYGRRVGGRVGTWIASMGARLAGTAEPIRIPIELVDEFGASIRLSVRLRDVERVERLDRWLRERFIGRIPGSHDAAE